MVFRSSDGFMPAVAPRERFGSGRYKELTYTLAAKVSYRETADLLNRIRNQEGGAKATTVRNQTERAGVKLYRLKRAKSSEVFEGSGFDDDGHKLAETYIDCSEAQSKVSATETTSEKAAELGVTAPIDGYEDGFAAVNISIDEVCCKRQTDTRPRPDDEKDSPKQVRNTVIHIQQGKGSYTVVGETVTAAMTLLMGFLLSNGLLGKYPLTFFADGARSIKSAVDDYFGFTAYRYILDWPHLAKKSAELLSSAIKGKDKRNEVHTTLKQLLWRGDVDAALDFLCSLPDDVIKSAAWLDSLKTYLTRNQDTIPCYALRKGLGLRISSNLGEKANDRLVSHRQKHNGMAWSKDGSFGLASVCATRINDELDDWLHFRSVPFVFCLANAA